MLHIAVLTDGKVGDVAQCLGLGAALADTLGGTVHSYTLTPSPFWDFLAPWGPVPPMFRGHGMRSLFTKGQPDILIVSGRRAIPYARAAKQFYGGGLFSIILKNPRCHHHCADFIWMPLHDGGKGRGVMTTLTGPHRLTRMALDHALAAPFPTLDVLPHPRVAVLLGGENKQFAYEPSEDARVIAALEILIEQGASLMITASRRTPPSLVKRLRDLPLENVFLWDGQGDNPYLPMLARADGLFITADSANMLSEAAMTGNGIMLYMPQGKPKKFQLFYDGLVQAGLARLFVGELEIFSTRPVNATPLIAEAVAEAYKQHKYKNAL